MCYNYIIALTSSSSDTATAATIGGAVGGAVLLISLVTLCCVVWCVVHCYKRKKPARSNQPRFKPSLRIYNGNPHYIFEKENTETTTGVEARMCKWLLHKNNANFQPILANNTYYQ